MLFGRRGAPIRSIVCAWNNGSSIADADIEAAMPCHAIDTVSFKRDSRLVSLSGCSQHHRHLITFPFLSIARTFFLESTTFPPSTLFYAAADPSATSSLPAPQKFQIRALKIPDHQVPLPRLVLDAARASIH
jgi:hypothetical protein